MAFAQNLRQIFSRVSSSTSPILSQLSSIRLNTTLTSPKLFVSESMSAVQLSGNMRLLVIGVIFEKNPALFLLMYSVQAGQHPPLSFLSMASIKVDDGLSRMTTDEKFTEAFAPFGQLVEAKIIVDRPTGKSKGFGFVTYASIEEAEKAREAMNAKFLDGWVIFVDPAKPREPRPPPQHESQSQQNGYSVNMTVGYYRQ